MYLHLGLPPERWRASALALTGVPPRIMKAKTVAIVTRLILGLISSPPLRGSRLIALFLYAPQVVSAGMPNEYLALGF